MKALALAPIVALAAGCIISSDDTSSGANLIVTWSLEALATQSPAPCPTGYDTAAVYSQEVDANGSAVGDPVIDLFNCSDGTGTTSKLTGITYSEYVAIATDDNTQTYGTSVPLLVDVMTSPQEADTPPIYTDAGHFKLQWELDRSGSAVTCGDVPNAYSVELRADNGTGPVTSAPFDCGDTIGYSDAYLAGSYTVTVALLTATGAQIGVSDPIAATIQTSATQGNTIVDLHTVTIPVP